jgi:predicted ABC-type transport system involved in lysophospholipase L1 biosynthesis ATPase subunit
LTALENVRVPAEILGDRELAARAPALLERMGLSDRAHHYPSQLSGGEMQRVAIARALANRPAVVLADEPTGELDAATGQEILGTPLETLGDGELTRLRLTRLGFIFQRFHLLPVLTARENVELPMAEAGLRRPERQARARELLDFVGLGHRAEHRATQLSGGEMQREAIARALANRPAVVLADEPTGELDAATGQDILALFRRLNQGGTTLVVVTHDDRLAAEASRVIHMLDGTIRD